MTPDTLAALYARGADQKAALLKQAGGSLSVNQVAQRLGISWQAVDQQRRAGQLLAVLAGPMRSIQVASLRGTKWYLGWPRCSGKSALSTRGLRWRS